MNKSVKNYLRGMISKKDLWEDFYRYSDRSLRPNFYGINDNERKEAEKNAYEIGAFLATTTSKTIISH